MGMASTEISLTDAPDPLLQETILQGLTAFNADKFGPGNFRRLAIAVKNSDNKVIGGLWGHTSWEWLFVEYLFVPESMRRRGLGSELLRRAETEAMSRGCRGAHLETLNVEARCLYERLGYAVFGALPDNPTGNTRFFLQKSLAG
jgi:GNAT superfamily N-acetyltransferase